MINNDRDPQNFSLPNGNLNQNMWLTPKKEYSIGKIRFHKTDYQKNVFKFRKSVSNEKLENILLFVTKMDKLITLVKLIFKTEKTTKIFD